MCKPICTTLAAWRALEVGVNIICTNLESSLCNLQKRHGGLSAENHCGERRSKETNKKKAYGKLEVSTFLERFYFILFINGWLVSNLGWGLGRNSTITPKRKVEIIVFQAKNQWFVFSCLKRELRSRTKLKEPKVTVPWMRAVCRSWYCRENWG